MTKVGLRQDADGESFVDILRRVSVEYLECKPDHSIVVTLGAQGLILGTPTIVEAFALGYELGAYHQTHAGAVSSTILVMPNTALKELRGREALADSEPVGRA
jgi:hypothetical protein